MKKENCEGDTFSTFAPLYYTYMIGCRRDFDTVDHIHASLFRHRLSMWRFASGKTNRTIRICNRRILLKPIIWIRIVAIERHKPMQTISMDVVWRANCRLIESFCCVVAQVQPHCHCWRDEFFHCAAMNDLNIHIYIRAFCWLKTMSNAIKYHSSLRWPMFSFRYCHHRWFACVASDRNRAAVRVVAFRQCRSVIAMTPVGLVVGYRCHRYCRHYYYYFSKKATVVMPENCVLRSNQNHLVIVWKCAKWKRYMSWTHEQIIFYETWYKY